MKKKIWNVALGELLHVEGVVAEDVLSKAGTVLLPSGVTLSALKETQPEIISLLLKQGITHVKVKNLPAITAGEFRTALDYIVPSVAQLNPLLTRIAIHQFGAIFRNIENRTMREKGIKTMRSIASHIPRELRRTPQVTLSLVDAQERPEERLYVHSINTSLLAGFIAQKLFPISPAFVESVIVGALFHDIGKAFFPISTWSENRKVIPGADRIRNCHPLLGETLLKDVETRDEVLLSAIRSHHEKWDGSGGPDRLAGELIPISARIVAVANVFENLTNQILHEDIVRSDQAVSLMIGLSTSDFDSRIMRALLSAIGLYPPGTIVLLSDQRVGIVLETKERNLLCPKVLVCLNAAGGKMTPFETLRIKKEGSIYIREALDDFSKRKLEPYVPVAIG